MMWEFDDAVVGIKTFDSHAVIYFGRKCSNVYVPVMISKERVAHYKKLIDEIGEESGESPSKFFLELERDLN